MNKLKAYVLSTEWRDDGAEIVFAETRNKARAMHNHSPWSLAGSEYIEIKAKREPRADKYCRGVAEMLNGYEERTQRIMRELGWDCLKASSCEECGNSEWELISETHLVEDPDDPGCLLCKQCLEDRKQEAVKDGNSLLQRN